MNLSTFNDHQTEEEKLAVYDGVWSKGEVFWDTGELSLYAHLGL